MTTLRNEQAGSVTPEMMSPKEGLKVFFGWVEKSYPQGVKELVEVVGSLMPSNNEVITEELTRSRLSEFNLNQGLNVLSSWLTEIGVGGFRDIGGIKRSVFLKLAGALKINLPPKEMVSETEIQAVLKSFSATMKNAEAGGMRPVQIIGSLLAESIMSKPTNNGSSVLRAELVRVLGSEQNLSWLRDALGVKNKVEPPAPKPTTSALSLKPAAETAPEKGRQIRFSELGKRFARGMVRSEELSKKSQATIGDPSAPRLTETEKAERQTLFKEINVMNGLFESRYGVIDDGLFSQAFNQLDVRDHNVHLALVNQKKRLVNFGIDYWTKPGLRYDEIVGGFYDDIVSELKKINIKPKYPKKTFINEFTKETLVSLPEGVMIPGETHRPLASAEKIMECFAMLNSVRDMPESYDKTEIIVNAQHDILVALAGADESTLHDMVMAARSEQSNRPVSGLEVSQFYADLINTLLSFEATPKTDSKDDEIFIKAISQLGKTRGGEIKFRAGAVLRFLAHVGNMSLGDRRRLAGIVLGKEDPADSDVSQMYADVVYTMINSPDLIA